MTRQNTQHFLSSLHHLFKRCSFVEMGDAPESNNEASLIDQRPIAQAEIELARTVFGNTIPYDNVILTNLGGMSGRAFTAPGVDGKNVLQSWTCL